MHEINLHISGSCDTQTRHGGWEAILQCGARERLLQGSARDTTVHEMELTAVVEALKALKQSGSSVRLFTHSHALERGIKLWLPEWIQRDWKNARGQLIANLGLWQQLHALLAQHAVTVTWIPRVQNARADTLAQAARKEHTSNGIVPSVADAARETSVAAAQTVPTFHLLIAGSRDATREALDYARRVVRRAHQLGYTVVVGDHPQGVDRAVVQECRRLQTPVIVAGISTFPRNGGCKHGTYVKVDRALYRSAGGRLLNAYAVRDRWMVDLCQRAVFVWNGDSPGTNAGYVYALQRGKQAHRVTFAPKGSAR